MKLWPFKKKVEEPVQQTITEEPKTVEITSDDSGMHRAELAMRHAGFAINATLYNQLPWIAQVFDAYKQLDFNEGYRQGQDKKGE